MIRYCARWVLPITAPPILGGAVCVDRGRIAYVGTRLGAPPGDDYELGDALLMPGLVNTHTHLELTAMRGFLEGLDFRSWIARLTAARRDVCTHRMLLDAARLGINEGLRAGITTYADTCESGVAIDAMRERGVRGIMYQEVFGPDPAQCEESLAGLRAKINVLHSRQTTLVGIGVSPHAPYSVSDALFQATARYAQDVGLPMAIHIAESELEQQLVTEGEGGFAEFLRGRGIPVAPRGRSPIEMLARLGVLDARPLLIHCVRATEHDVRIVAMSRSAIAHCPASNAKLGHGIAPLAAFLAAKISVGLGSDSMASNNRMDLLGEARLAILQQCAHEHRHDVITAAEALRLATLGGASALGLAAEIGSLERGKAADLAAFALDGQVGPVHTPEHAAVFALHGAEARLVTVAGRALVRDGQLVRPNRGLEARVQRTADRLQHWLANADSTLGVLARGEASRLSYQ